MSGKISFSDAYLTGLVINMGLWGVDIKLFLLSRLPHVKDEKCGVKGVLNYLPTLLSTQRGVQVCNTRFHSLHHIMLLFLEPYAF